VAHGESEQKPGRSGIVPGCVGFSRVRAKAMCGRWHAVACSIGSSPLTNESLQMHVPRFSIWADEREVLGRGDGASGSG
jgi:hypothetical protein